MRERQPCPGQRSATTSGAKVAYGEEDARRARTVSASTAAAGAALVGAGAAIVADGAVLPAAAAAVAAGVVLYCICHLCS